MKGLKSTANEGGDSQRRRVHRRQASGLSDWEATVMQMYTKARTGTQVGCLGEVGLDWKA